MFSWPRIAEEICPHGGYIEGCFCLHVTLHSNISLSESLHCFSSRPPTTIYCWILLQIISNRYENFPNTRAREYGNMPVATSVYPSSPDAGTAQAHLCVSSYSGDSFACWHCRFLRAVRTCRPRFFPPHQNQNPEIRSQNIIGRVDQER